MAEPDIPKSNVSGPKGETRGLLRYIGSLMGRKVYVDVVAVDTGPGKGLSSVANNVATNGDSFPIDSPTVYEYDQSGENIVSITRTTLEGVSYKQTWTRNGMGQLQNRSGWVKQ